MANRDIHWRRYKIKETLYLGQWRLSPLQSGHVGTSQFAQSPSAAPSYFPESHQWSEISSLSKVNLVLGKARNRRMLNLGWNGGRGWVTWVIWCFTKKPCTRHDAWAGVLLRWSCQSPVAHSYGLLNHLNSFCGEMFKLNAKFDADSLLYLLNHFECDTHTVHMLTQWHVLPPLTSTVKSSLFMHVYYSPLSLVVSLNRYSGNYSHIYTGCTFSGRTLYMSSFTIFKSTHNKYVFHNFPKIDLQNLTVISNAIVSLNIITDEHDLISSYYPNMYSCGPESLEVL